MPNALASNILLHKKRSIKRELRSQVLDYKGVAGLRESGALNNLSAECRNDTNIANEPSSSKPMIDDEQRLQTIETKKMTKRKKRK